MQGVVEHGVLFHRTTGNAAEQKKVLSVLKYWVTGYVDKKWYKLRNVRLQLRRFSFFMFFSLVISLLNLHVQISFDVLKRNYILIMVEFDVSLCDPKMKWTLWYWVLCDSNFAAENAISKMFCWFAFLKHPTKEDWFVSPKNFFLLLPGLHF